jgi:hypothetical protein
MEILNAIQLRRTALQGFCALFAVVCVLFDKPQLAIIPTFLHACLFFPKVFRSFRKLTPRNHALAIGSGLILIGLTMSESVRAIEFSFLLSATQQAMESCIFNQVAGLVVLSGIIFTGFRGLVMIGLAYVSVEAFQERQKQQDATHQIKTIVIAVIMILVVGAFEPLIAGPGCDAAA